MDHLPLWQPLCPITRKGSFAPIYPERINRTLRSPTGIFQLKGRSRGPQVTLGLPLSVGNYYMSITATARYLYLG